MAIQYTEGYVELTVMVLPADDDFELKCRVSRLTGH